MLLRTFRAKNYKSLRETPVLAFDAGINVIVGQNNVGKTALLEGLSGQATNTPHRSLKAFPNETTPSHDTITFEFGVDIDKQELVELCKNKISEPWMIYAGPAEADYQKRVFALFERSVFRFEGANIIGPNGGLRATHAVYNGQVWPPVGEQTQLLQFSHRQQEALTFVGVVNTNATHGHVLEHQVVAHAMSRFYMFRAERLNVHRHPMGETVELNPDASNLPQVLDNLQSNPARYRRYVSFVQRIFPHVHDIRVVSLGSNDKEIRAWMAPVETERTDLSFPLNNCGTGIGQVLAMLYVVLNSPVPRTLIIDEPNSFLHPGAVRELVRIFQENPRHQYIVSTHSPAVAEATRPTSVHQSSGRRS